MNRTSVAAALAAFFVFTASDLYAQTGSTGATSPSASPGSRSGANATATGSTPTGAAVPAPTASGRASARGGDAKSASAKLDLTDRKFIEDAAAGGMKEVEFGRVATDKASDPAVKAFAERMVRDHSDTNNKLMDVAQSKGVTPPAKLKSSDQRALDRMVKKSGAEFDRAYMDDMVKDHNKDVKNFEKEASKAKDSEVKAFAADTLPVLQQHLQLARDTQGKLKGGGSAATRSSGSSATAGGTGSSSPSAKASGAKK